MDILIRRVLAAVERARTAGLVARSPRMLFVPEPVDDEEFPIAYFPAGAILQKWCDRTDSGITVTFDLVERDLETPGTGGTDVTSSPVTATSSSTKRAMNNWRMAPNSILVYKSSGVTGDVADKRLWLWLIVDGEVVWFTK